MGFVNSMRSAGVSEEMSGVRKNRYGFDFLNTLSQKIGDLSGFVPMCRELIQNADDEQCEWISFEFSQDALIVRNPSNFSEQDWENIRTIGSESKREDPKKAGRFGIGFVSVFQICDYPEIYSNRIKMTICPEQQKTLEEDCNFKEGTEFKLKWATEQSKVRQGLKKPTILISKIPEFQNDLIEHLSENMLFLKYVRNITVLSKDGRQFIGARNDKPEEYTRTILVEEVDGKDKKTVNKSWWMVFDHQEKDDVDISGVLRNGSVAVAFPLIIESIEDYNGLLYTTLPTRTYTDMPISINGDFAVKSDRMTIIDEGNPEEVEWNRKLVHGIADLYVSGMLEARNLIEDQQYANLLPSENYSNPSCPLLKEIPEKFIEVAIDKNIVPTTDSDQKWKSPQDSRLLSRKINECLYDSLAGLNASLVIPELRGRWNFLRTCLGINTFSLTDLCDLFQEIGIDTPITKNDLPQSLLDDPHQEALWKFIDQGLGDEPDQDSIGIAKELPLCPTESGDFYRFEDVYVIPESLVEALPLIRTGFPRAQETFLNNHRGLCDKLCRKLPWFYFIEVFVDKTGKEILAMEQSGEIDLAALYNFISDCEDDIEHDEEVINKIAKLQICPTKGGENLYSLDKLFLPGNFDDPIGLDILIDTEDTPDRVIGTFKKLGLKKLSFIEYAKRVVPSYFDDVDTNGETDHRVDLLLLIKKRSSELDDCSEVFDILKSKNCILGADGKYYEPSEVYIDFDGLEEVFEAFPTPNPLYGNLQDDESLVNFFIKIGVNSKPQMNHLIQQIRILTAKPFKEGVSKIEAVFYYIANNINKLNEDEINTLRHLQTIEWLPVENDDKYELPSNLFLRSQAELVGSQAEILRFTREAAMKRLFRDTIGLKSQPDADILIANLKDLRSRNEAADINIYRVLNDLCKNLEPKHTYALKEEPLLYLGGNIGYVHGYKALWIDSRFPGYRYTLPEELKRYRALLFDVMGTKDQIEDEDYIEILAEIANKDKYRKSHSGVSEDDKKLIMMIYAHLSELVQEVDDCEEEFAEWIERCKGLDAVLCRSGQLKKPKHCFFADKEWLIQIFEEIIGDLLVDNDPQTRPFLEAIGVRSLGASAYARDFKEPSNIETSKLQEVLRSKKRKKEYRRIVETFQHRDNVFKWHLYLMLNTEISECDNLEVEYALKIEGKELVANIFEVDSYFNDETQTLYLARTLNDELKHLEVSRQLAGILCPDLDAASLAPPIAYVLNPDSSDDQVHRILSYLGMDEIDESHITPPVEGPKGEADTILDETEEDEEEEKGVKKGEKVPGVGSTGGVRGTSTGVGTYSPGGTSRPQPTAEEVAGKRKDYFKKKAIYYADRDDFESNDNGYGFDDDRKPLTPEELEDHKKQVMVFYNRQIREISRRLDRLNNGEENYDIYSSEWDNISKNVRTRDGNRCRRCEITEEVLKGNGSHLTVHHIIPRKKGGSNWPSNLISLCIACHREVENSPELL